MMPKSATSRALSEQIVRWARELRKVYDEMETAFGEPATGLYEARIVYLTREAWSAVADELRSRIEADRTAPSSPRRYAESEGPMPESEHTPGRQAAIEAAAKDWYERVRQAKGWAQVGNGWRKEWLARTEPIIDAYERALAEQSQEESRADEALCRFCGGEGWIGGELEPRRPCTGCNAEARATAIADLTAERDDIDRRLLELRTQGPRISLVPRARTEAERTCQFCGKLIPIPEQTYGIDPRNLCHCCKVPRNEENR